jgi:hypothetical protein
MDRALRLLPFSSPLKRFYKFLLKKVLGNFLQYDLDMHQLDVQLAKGEIELRDLEINVQVSLRASFDSNKRARAHFRRCRPDARLHAIRVRKNTGELR